MAPQNKYTHAHRQFLTINWAAGKAASVIAAAMSAKFGIPCSRNAIIALADRMNLPERATTGPWRAYTPRQVSEPKKKPKPPEPTGGLMEPIPTGPIGDFPENGLCRWPVAEYPAFQCCGAEQEGGKPYCSYHAAKAFSKPHTARP